MTNGPTWHAASKARTSNFNRARPSDRSRRSRRSRWRSASWGRAAFQEELALAGARLTLVLASPRHRQDARRAVAALNEQRSDHVARSIWLRALGWSQPGAQEPGQQTDADQQPLPASGSRRVWPSVDAVAYRFSGCPTRPGAGRTAHGVAPDHTRRTRGRASSCGDGSDGGAAVSGSRTCTMPGCPARRRWTPRD